MGDISISWLKKDKGLEVTAEMPQGMASTVCLSNEGIAYPVISLDGKEQARKQNAPVAQGPSSMCVDIPDDGRHVVSISEMKK